MDINNYFYILLLCLLVGCGGSSSTEDNQGSIDITPNAFGRLIDSEVKGLKYKSGEHEGITDENGEFSYILGEQIQFFVGDIAIGYQIEPKDILTLYDLANNNSFAALNIARFLQSIDDDAIINNGIQITESSHNLSKNKTLDFLSQEWREESVINSTIEQLVYLLTQDTLSGSRYLVSSYSAYLHLSSTLDLSMNEIKLNILDELNISGCKSNNECGQLNIDTSYIGYCPPSPESYAYSKTTTDYVSVSALVLERMEIMDIKSELYNVADTPVITGVCFKHETQKYPSCNNEGQCEISIGIPVIEIP